jgi:hypothetical protein
MVRKRAAGKILLRLPGSCVPWIIREYDVPENLAQRLEGYFTEGAKDSGLMSASGSIMMNTTITGTSTVTAHSAVKRSRSRTFTPPELGQTPRSRRPGGTGPPDIDSPKCGYG